MKRSDVIRYHLREAAHLTKLIDHHLARAEELWGTDGPDGFVWARLEDQVATVRAQAALWGETRFPEDALDTLSDAPGSTERRGGVELDAEAI